MNDIQRIAIALQQEASAAFPDHNPDALLRFVLKVVEGVAELTSLAAEKGIDIIDQGGSFGQIDHDKADAVLGASIFLQEAATELATQVGE